MGSTAAGGTVILTNGVVAYTPPANACGSDSFCYLVSDGQAGATAIGMATVTIPCAQVSGQVALEIFVGLGHNGNGTRDVTFSITDGATFTNHVVQSLNLVGGTAAYTLSAPTDTSRISAKTAWHLRQRFSPTFVAQQATVNFLLKGGDLDGSNLVDIVDYFKLAAAWYTSAPEADFDGSGLVDLDDYFLLASHWYDSGDAP